MTSQARGKAGGEDGVVAEFVQALSPEQKCRLADLIHALLCGSVAAPQGWKHARVTLIPKVAGALLATQFRPIIVLPYTLKLSIRVRLKMAEPYLRLRRKSSHGFRPGVQAAEVHEGMRHLLSARSEWGHPTVIAKIDVAKAQDTLEHSAIHNSFQRRGMPAPLQAAYWRCHAGRVLHFCSSDGGIKFSARPTRGVPQGSPESPVVYAVVIEDAISDTEEEFRRSRRPAGIAVPVERSAREADRAKHIHTTFGADSFAYIKFADETYMFGRREDQVSFVASVLSRRLAHDGQHICAEKSEFLAAGTSGRFFSRILV